MPTPVTTARQCLTLEAAQALDDAVAVARRRGHAQTTSLHAVSALLALPSSALREACGRARNAAYPSKIQFKALELCLGVSLDRLPSAPQRVDEPPVSNSLMAAIKRSQANQRRQPENFQLYHQQQQQTSSISMVKVELQNLILSILDDPVVSRVFGEAGFRSCDIRLAILRPVHQLLRYSRFKGPPLFLCNLTDDSDLGRRGFSFPFLGGSAFSDGDENCRRIGEVLARKKGRNPLLIGVCAHDALHHFLDIVERQRGGVLPVQISGLNAVCVENDISRFITETYSEWLVKLRFQELGRMVEHCTGPGVVINYGDLKALIGDGASVATLSCVVGELTRLMDLHGEKVWLIGAASTYETYLKFLNIFPSIENAWNLQLLPITSLRPSIGESCPKSKLMESFVPFGGFFSTPDLKIPLSSSYQCVSSGHLFDQKSEQKPTDFSKEGFTASVADHYESNLPSWLQMAKLSTKRGLDHVKAKDDSLLLNPKTAGQQEKCGNICQLRHQNQLPSKADISQIRSQDSAVVGFHVADDENDHTDNRSINDTNASSSTSAFKNVNSCMSVDLRKSSSSKPSLQLPEASKAVDENFLSGNNEYLELDGVKSPPLSLSNSSVGYSHTSPTSATSVTTDLGLGIYPASTGRELSKPTKESHVDLLQNFSSSFSADVDLLTAIVPNHPAQSSPCPCPDLNGRPCQRDFKMLYRALSERISWQKESVSVICQTVARCRTRNERRNGASLRGDIWFIFLGPDRFGKKRTAIALAEALYGSSDNFIYVDLSSQDGIIRSNTIRDHEERDDYDVKFRGKTVVDYIAGELSKKPLSVVYLENIDEADLLAQSSLSQAERTGRFSDSYGREVSINNAVFVTTSSFTKGNNLFSARGNINYSEETVVRAKGQPIQMLVSCASGNVAISNGLTALNGTKEGIPDTVFVNKRKLTGTDEAMETRETSEMVKRPHKASNLYLDLNFPAEEIEFCNTAYGNSRSDAFSENSKAWLENFMERMDGKVIFKPFDFDALAEKILKEIRECFLENVCSKCLLEIDSEVMEQILAAGCALDDSKVTDWVKQVLSRGFAEAQKRYNLTAYSVIKLVNGKDLSLEEQAPGVYLPSKIVIN